MIIRFFKFTKLPQLTAAVIVSILINLAFIDLNNLINELYGLFVLILIFFLSLFIISKNSILKNNQYTSLCFIIFCGIYFKMPSQISITVSYFFLLLSLRKVYSLKSKKNKNKKLFDMGFWFIISLILNPINSLFIITIFSGLLTFYKVSFVALLKISIGMLSASLMAIFIQALSLNIYEFTDLLLYIPEQILEAYNSIELISNQGYDHWLFVFVSVGIFVYYFYRFFGNTIKEINKNLFLLTFFVNSSLLAFVINEYPIFLFFPFLGAVIFPAYSAATHSPFIK